VTLSDLAKYSVTRSTALSLQQLSFLSKYRVHKTCNRRTDGRTTRQKTLKSFRAERSVVLPGNTGNRPALQYGVLPPGELNVVAKVSSAVT